VLLVYLLCFCKNKNNNHTFQITNLILKFIQILFNFFDCLFIIRKFPFFRFLPIFLYRQSFLKTTILQSRFILVSHLHSSNLLCKFILLSHLFAYLVAPVASLLSFFIVYFESCYFILLY